MQVSVTVVPEESQRTPDHQAQEETEDLEEELDQDPLMSRDSDSGADPRPPTRSLAASRVEEGPLGNVARPTLKGCSEETDGFFPGCEGYYSAGE